MLWGEENVKNKYSEKGKKYKHELQSPPKSLSMRQILSYLKNRYWWWVKHMLLLYRDIPLRMPNDWGLNKELLARDTIFFNVILVNFVKSPQCKYHVWNVCFIHLQIDEWSLPQSCGLSTSQENTLLTWLSTRHLSTMEKEVWKTRRDFDPLGYIVSALLRISCQSDSSGPSAKSDFITLLSAKTRTVF